MGVIPDELFLVRLKRERESREAALAELRSLIDGATGKVAKDLSGVVARFTALEGAVSGFDSAAIVATAREAVAGDGYAKASQVTLIEASITALDTAIRATIEDTRVTLVSETESLARTINRVEATFTGEFGDITALIEEESLARATADGALATRTSNLEASVDTPGTGLLARVATVESTYATDSEVSAAISQEVTARNNAISSSVLVETNARIAADGAIHSQWGVRLNENGRMIGRIQLNGTNGTSTLDMEAGTIRLWNGTAAVPPFQLVGGQVRVANLSIISSDVGGLAATATNSDFSAVTGATKPANNADVTLTALNTGLVITSGGITLNGTPSIKSNNYVAGSTGWAIKGNGDVEFGSGVFRGTVTASAGQIGGFTVGGSSLAAGAGLNRVEMNSSSAPFIRVGDGSDKHIEMVGGYATGNPEFRVKYGSAVRVRIFRTEFIGVDTGRIEVTDNGGGSVFINGSGFIDGNGSITMSGGQDHRIGANRFAGDGMDIAYYASGDRYAVLDFHAQSSGAESARIIRDSGANAGLRIENYGGGDISVSPIGGYVRFGEFTATATAVAGYMMVKDAAGNLRKLAVLS